MTPQDIEAIIALVQSHHRRGTLDSHGVYLLRNDLHDLNRWMLARDENLAKAEKLRAITPRPPLLK